MHCEVWEAATEGRHLTGTRSGGHFVAKSKARHLTGGPTGWHCLCQSQEQAWLPQCEKSNQSFPCFEVVISEVQTKTSGDLNPSMCTHVQILQAEPSVSVYQHCRVKLEEFSSSFHRSVSLSNYWSAPRAGVTEVARLRWPDRLARFPILLGPKPWPLQRQLQIRCSKPAPKKKSFSHVCMN